MENNKNRITQSVKHKGFSLIEVLVSLSIFTMVITIAVSTLLVLIDSNSRAQNSQEIITNLSFALDSMTREMRTGRDYYCSNSTLPEGGDDVRDCAGGAGAITFNEGGRSLTADAGSRRIAFRLQNGSLQRRLGNGNWIDVTSDRIVIDTLRFYTTGTNKGDNFTPTVTIYIAGIVDSNEGTETTFNIQTTAAQQLLDL